MAIAPTLGIDRAKQDMTPDALGYSSLHLGLNNQKAALLGLMIRAGQGPRRFTLPRMCLDRTGENKLGNAEFGDIFDLEGVRRFADAFELEIVPGEPLNNIGGYDCFSAGAHGVGRAGQRGLVALNDFECQFFNHLVPLICRDPAFKMLADIVFNGLKIETVIQIRIEADWMYYSKGSLKYSAEKDEDYHPTFQQIFEKVKNTPEIPSKIVYVVCDEANLLVPKDEIRREVEAQHDIILVWKSDILSPGELERFSVLELSLIDFEMSALAPYFVGLSRSTFSDLLLFEKLCRTRRTVTTHYIYNLPGPRLGQRMDSASEIVPSRVVNPLFARQPLIEPHDEDCRWSAVLTCHVWQQGDLHSETTNAHGVRGGPLVCGARRSKRGLIEGFSLRLAAGTPVDIEYRALENNGTWSAWAPGGEYVGSRGRDVRIRGFAVRLTGPLARRFEVLYAGSFFGHPDVINAQDGEDCRAPGLEELEAMQIVFRPRFLVWPTPAGSDDLALQPEPPAEEPLGKAPRDGSAPRSSINQFENDLSQAAGPENITRRIERLRSAHPKT